MIPVEVHGRGPVPAKIMIIGEAPGEEEVQARKPFVGKSGKELQEQLEIAFLDQRQIYFTNVCKERPKDNKIELFITRKKKTGVENGWPQFGNAWVDSRVLRWHEMLQQEIDRVRPNILVAAGGTALWALTGQWDITSMRGNVLEGVMVKGRQYKTIATYHPSYILRAPQDRSVAIQDLRRVRKEADSPLITPRPERAIVRPSFETVMDFIARGMEKLQQGPVEIVIDLETRIPHIACCGIGYSKDEALCIPFMQVSRNPHYWTLDEEFAIVKALKQLLTHPNAEVIGQNLLYDCQYIAKWWFFIPRVKYDTMIMQHSIFPTHRKGLEFLVSIYSEHPRYWKVEGKNWEPWMGEDQLWGYNCKDCMYTFEMKEKIGTAIKKLGMWEQFQWLQDQFMPTLEMMLAGTKIDLDMRERLSIELQSDLEKRLERITYLAGHKLNPNSPKQLSRFFYDDLLIKPVMVKNAKGEWTKSTDDDALKTIAQRAPITKPLTDAISECRTIRLFRNNYVEADLDEDNRLRCSYNICGTKTYRFSSSASAFGTGTNLQNIPQNISKLVEFLARNGPHSGEQILQHGFKEKDINDAVREHLIVLRRSGYTAVLYLPSLRRMFGPDEGYTWVDMDLKGADAQVVAWDAHDELLMQMFREGVDVHTENSKVIKMSRQMAKIFVHGTNYVGGPRTMASHCGITVHEAEIGQRRWFAEHPAIYEWHRKTENEIRTVGVVRNQLGFRCPILGRAEQMLPEACAWKAQSTVALVINKAMVNIHRAPVVVDFRLQVHDSLDYQIPTGSESYTLPLLKTLSAIPIPYDDPLVIPVEFALSTKSWGDCEKVAV